MKIFREMKGLPDPDEEKAADDKQAAVISGTVTPAETLVDTPVEAAPAEEKPQEKKEEDNGV